MEAGLPLECGKVHHRRVKLVLVCFRLAALLTLVTLCSTPPSFPKTERTSVILAQVK